MELLTEQMTLSRFLYLLSFDTKHLKIMTPPQAHSLREEFMLIHTIFSSTAGAGFTKMYRTAVLGKCSALNGVILKKFPLD